MINPLTKASNRFLAKPAGCEPGLSAGWLYTNVLPALRLSCLLFLGIELLHSAPALAREATLTQQRELYVSVKKSLDRGSTSLFKQHLQELQDYPLFPYLEYTRLTYRLSVNDEPAVSRFLQKYDDSWLNRRLRRNWLKLLYRKELWQLYQDYYLESAANTEIKCRYYFARYQSGEKQAALEGGLKLWVVGNSQPKGCDPLFKLLIAEQRISNEVAWQRYTLAILNHEYQLGRYVERFFSSDKYRQLATSYVSLDRNPRQLAEHRLFDANTPVFMPVIAHAIRHLARRDAPAARKYWAHYESTQPFDKNTQQQVLTALVKGLYRQGYEDVAASYLRDHISIADTALLEWQLRNSLQKGDWNALITLIEILPDELREHERWRYWHARGLLLHTTKASDIDAAKTTLREISRFRSFYGFLACDWIDNPYNLQDRPVAVTDEEIERMANKPSIERARELLFHRQYLNARREWYNGGINFDSIQWQTAARIAQKWQWHGQVILAMARAKYWDDIDMRFPLVYGEEFRHNAQQRHLPPPLLYAIARQESAFRPLVTSPAGARGLMQLMPATAKEVARKHRIPYKNSQQLFDPDLNIRLGSQYYADVLQRFGGNRILTTAAYNAGPHRVSRWRKKSAGKLPFDAWVETIPFKETRQYVQNVLSFAVIYSILLDQDDPLLSAKERGQQL
ncbi:MAG: hypothetical protein DRR06_02180 [Gammaproteobacteria bacterium]|nr:MAG: hypothetical protein DRR06_02180 [Gammaproteobacteria bacterium]